MADEFRIEIVGRFAGSCISEAAHEWERALGEASSRKIVIDITRLSSYDVAGRQLLAHMHAHGTTIAAGTPLSLVFLHEITDASRPAQMPVLEPAAPKKAPVLASSGLRTQAAGK